MGVAKSGTICARSRVDNNRSWRPARARHGHQGARSIRAYLYREAEKPGPLGKGPSKNQVFRLVGDAEPFLDENAKAVVVRQDIYNLCGVLSAGLHQFLEGAAEPVKRAPRVVLAEKLEQHPHVLEDVPSGEIRLLTDLHRLLGIPARLSATLQGSFRINGARVGLGVQKNALL